MKAIYFDCFSGVSGDMILGALLDAGLKLPHLKKELRKIPLKGYDITQKIVTKQGFKSTRINIKNSDKPLSVNQMISLIKQSRLDKSTKETILRLIQRIVDAETKVHGVKLVTHLHELGSIDTFIDISSAIIGMHLLGIEKVYASPLPIFRGFVKTQHGRIPLPAPATAELLKGFPVYPVEQTDEIVTPTGALIITSLAEPVSQMPVMTINQIGYGAGNKDFPTHPNMLRVFLGNINPQSAIRNSKSQIWILETNLDDVSPQIIGYVFDKLLKAGALDVWMLPIQMKKSRLGTLLKVLTEEKNIPKLEQIIFSETTTFGIRRYPVWRTVLDRRIQNVKTKYGIVRLKIGTLNGKTMSISPEYEDCRKIAEARNMPLKQVYQKAMDCFW